MKYIFLMIIFSLINSPYLHSQESHPYTYRAGNDSISMPLINGKINYTGIIKTDSSKSKDFAYTALITWLVKIFATSNNIIQYEDKENGIIICRPDISVKKNKAGDSYGVVSYLMTIRIKQGRFKYEFTDFVHEYIIPDDPTGKDIGAGPLERKNADGVQEMSDGELIHIKQEVNFNISVLILSLKHAVDQYSADSNNW